MSVQRKLLIYLTCLSGLLLAGILYQQYADKQRAELLIRDAAQKRIFVFDKIIELKGANLEALARDYSLWDEMIAFVKSGNRKWAKENIENRSIHFNFDTAWVLRKDFSAVHSVLPAPSFRLDDPSVLSPGFLQSLLRQNPFPHFFLHTSHGYMEIRGAPIQPSKDERRASAPEGYFFVGRLWDEGFLNELAKTTATTIELVPAADSGTHLQKTNLSKGFIIFHRTYNSWNNSPLFYLQVQRAFALSKDLSDSARVRLVSEVVFISGILFLFSAFLFFRVSRPLALISRSLKTESGQPIERLRKKNSEFGLIAEQIINSFAKKKDLEREIRERARIAKELEQHQGHLEEIVAERTANLSALNERLRLEIEERERTEKALRLDESRLESLLKISQMGDGPLNEIMNYIQEEAIRLTESAVGYLAFVREDETASAVHGWSKGGEGICRIADSSPSFSPIGKSALLEEAIKERRPVVTNGYAVPSPLKEGNSEGQIPLIRHMSVPVFDGDKIVAVAGVGNKPRDYDDSDIRQLTLLMSGMGRVMHRKRVMEDLKASKEGALRFARENEGLAEIGRIISSTMEIEEIFQGFADKVGKVIPFDLITVNTLSAQKGFLDILYSAGKSGSPIFPKGLSVPLSGTLSEEVLRTGQGIIFPIGDETSESPRIQIVSSLLRLGVAAMMVVPLMRNNQIIGTLGFFINSPGVYHEDQFRLGQGIASQIAGAISNAILFKDRQRMESALRESEEKYRSLMENLPVGIFRSTPGEKGEFLMVNPAYMKIFGIDSWEELQQINACDLYVDPGQRKNLSDRLISLGSVSGVEVQMRKKDGTPIWVSLTERITYGPDGKVSNFDGILEDITARKQAQQKILRSRKRLQQVFDGISDPMLMVGRNLKIKMFNLAAKGYYQLDFQTGIGRSCAEIFPTMDLCRSDAILASIQEGKACSLERKSPLDAHRFEKVDIYPLEQEGEEIAGAVLRITDITETKLIQRQLIQNEKLASLGLLVSGIAHEINNPNNFIIFNIPILREYLEEIMAITDRYADLHPEYELFGMRYPEFREDVFKLLENVEHGSQRIHGTVSKLREFSRTRDDRELVWVHPREIVEKSVSICHNELIKKIKRFEVEVPSEIPRIYTDPGVLEQALINLLVNAVQSSDKEESWIRVSANREKGNRGPVWVEVSDNGCGMNEGTLSKIFAPFFTTKKAGVGTGLGLYISRTLIESLGGTISVESKEGKGSTFRITLPTDDEWAKKQKEATARAIF